MNIDKPTTLAGQLEEAFNSVGTSMMNFEYAGKLLAFLLKYGGGMEAVTHHERMNADMMIAQEKFNIKGGCVPNIEGIKSLQKYYKELQQETEDLQCQWLWEIYLKYNLKTNVLKSQCPDYLIEKYDKIKK